MNQQSPEVRRKDTIVSHAQRGIQQQDTMMSNRTKRSSRTALTGMGAVQDNSELAAIKPEDWNNIALPVVDAFKAVIQDLKRIGFNQEMETKKLSMVERKEQEHFLQVMKEMQSIKENQKIQLTNVDSLLRQHIADVKAQLLTEIESQVKTSILEVTTKTKEDIGAALYESKTFAMKTSSQGIDKVKDELNGAIRQKEVECLRRMCIEGSVDFFSYETD